MASLNEVTLLGRLGKEPELQYTRNGQVVCRLQLATSETWKDQKGEKKESTEWHRVIVWAKTAEHCAKYLGKGSLVLVKGSLKTRKWDDQSGVTRYTTEIHSFQVRFLSSRKPEEKMESTRDAPTYERDEFQGYPAGSLDDVPF